MSKKDLLKNQIFTIENFLSPTECTDYISLSENIGYTEASITTNRGFEIRPNIRNNQRLILDEQERAAHLWSRVSNYIPSKIGRWCAVGLNERFRFYRYDSGQQFAPHQDGSYKNLNGEESLLTFMIYLNDNFKGGETHFYLPRNYGDLRDLKVTPITGMVLCFVHELLHEGTSVIEGRKYVLRSDVMYKRIDSISSWV